MFFAACVRMKSEAFVSRKEKCEQAKGAPMCRKGIFRLLLLSDLLYDHQTKHLEEQGNCCEDCTQLDYFLFE